MQVTFKGNPVTLEVTVIKAGNPVPIFTAIDNHLKFILSDLFTGKKFMLVFLRLIQKFVVSIKKRKFTISKGLYDFDELTICSSTLVWSSRD